MRQYGKLASLARVLGLKFESHTDGYGGWSGWERTGDRGSWMSIIEARLVQLECPKHSYKSEVCVKCGKPKEGK